jgi:[ribosomal protein S18]-alanine N-acetyltransferase
LSSVIIFAEIGGILHIEAIPSSYRLVQLRQMEEQSSESGEKVQALFLRIVIGAAAASAFAAGAALLTGCMPMIAAAGIGALIGAVSGFVLSILGSKEEPLDEYKPLAIPQDVKQVLPRRGNVEDCIERVEKVFSQRIIQLRQSFDLHALHHDVTQITDAVRGHASLHKIWDAFLEEAQAREVLYPDGYRARLNFSMQRSRLQGKIPEISLERIVHRQAGFSEDLRQIHALERECFTSNTVWSEEGLRHMLSSPFVECYVARKKGSTEILGVLWGRWEREEGGKNIFHICCIGRMAGAAKLGIGEQLLQTLLHQYPRSDFALEVRESNHSAIALYQKFGFEATGFLPSYYQDPTENAFCMRWNATKCQSFLRTA